MQRYKHWAPTAFDTVGLNLPDQQDWFVAPVVLTRDSGPLIKSNFHAFLEGLGGESDHVEIHRFGHWGPGWFEVILIDPSNEAIVKLGEEMEGSLENYPVLDEEAVSRLEWEEFEDNWAAWGERDYLKALSNRILQEWDGLSKHGYNADDLACEVGDLFDDKSCDTFGWFTSAKDDVNWLYECNGNETRINIDGLVDFTELDEVIDSVDAMLHDREVVIDIKKLCKAVGADDDVIKKAVDKRIVLLSGIRSLMATPFRMSSI